MAALRAAAPGLLEAVLQLATTGLEANARPIAARCPRCQQRRGVQSQRTRQVQTRLGPIRLRRWWHQCWACARGWSPPDQALELAPYQQTSPGLARWEAALGAITTFREAARLLADLAGVHVGSETLRTQAERVGTELEGQQRASMAVVEQTHEPPPAEHDPAPGTLVVETDGVMVRYRDRHLDGALVDGDWHEVKLGVAGGWQDGQLRQPSYVAAREPAVAFARRLGAEAARRGALDVVQLAPVGRHASRVAARGGAGRWSQMDLGARGHAVRQRTHRDRRLVSRQPAHLDGWPKRCTATTHPRPRRGPGPASIACGRTDRSHSWTGSTRARLSDATAAAVHKRERGYFSTNAAADAVPVIPPAALADRLRRGRILGQAPRAAAHEARWLTLERPRRARHPRPPLPPAQRTFPRLRRVTSYKARSDPSAGLESSRGWWPSPWLSEAPRETRTMPTHRVNGVMSYVIIKGFHQAELN